MIQCNQIPDLSLQGVTLGVFTLMYLLLVILMTRCFLNEVYLIIFSYSKCIISNTLMYYLKYQRLSDPFSVILASFFGIEVLIVLDSDPQTAASGVWCTMFFIYMTYTLLALHLQECAVAGVLLGITQLAAGAALNYQDPNMGKQVSLKGFIKERSLPYKVTPSKKWLDVVFSKVIPDSTGTCRNPMTMYLKMKNFLKAS